MHFVYFQFPRYFRYYARPQDVRALSVNVVCLSVRLPLCASFCLSRAWPPVKSGRALEAEVW